MVSASCILLSDFFLGDKEAYIYTYIHTHESVVLGKLGGINENFLISVLDIFT